MKFLSNEDHDKFSILILELSISFILSVFSIKFKSFLFEFKSSVIIIWFELQYLFNIIDGNEVPDPSF